MYVWIADVEPQGITVKTPAFVVGMPRSLAAWALRMLYESASYIALILLVESKNLCRDCPLPSSTQGDHPVERLVRCATLPKELYRWIAEADPHFVTRNDPADAKGRFSEVAVVPDRTLYLPDSLMASMSAGGANVPLSWIAVPTRLSTHRRVAPISSPVDVSAAAAPYAMCQSPISRTPSSVGWGRTAMEPPLPVPGGG